MSDTMKCYTCGRVQPQRRHVKLRGDVRAPYCAKTNEPGSLVHQHYINELTYRSAFVCEACYLNLDSGDGTAVIDGRGFGIAGSSRNGKAKIYDAKKYDAFQRRQAKQLGQLSQ